MFLKLILHAHTIIYGNTLYMFGNRRLKGQILGLFLASVCLGSIHGVQELENACFPTDESP